ncbi:MAG: DUF3016 domain-containing protein [Proteobacteria bacterium]|nr:DUF3016 domain-containing protein [Pseudomonadota bacterium]
MRTPKLLTAALLIAAAAAHAQVQVTYQEPQKFTEFAGSTAAFSDGQRWLEELKTYIQTQAAERLPAGQQLAVTVTDLRRAGWVDPTFRYGQSVRIVRDIDAPRIDLQYRLTDAGGGVVREGSAQLRDLGFLSRPQRPGQADTLTHEKNLVDRWLDDFLGHSS